MSLDGAEYGQHYPIPNEPPPPYPLEKSAPVHRSWHPYLWSRRVKTFVTVLFTLLVAVGIALAVVATRGQKKGKKEKGVGEEEYPSYDKLDYRLIDKCTSFTSQEEPEVASNDYTRRRNNIFR